jgi:hypothetical protein
MQREPKNTSVGAVAGWSIAGLISVLFSATLLISALRDVAAGSGVLTKFFLCLLCAVAIVQISASVILLTARFKAMAKNTKAPLREIEQ